MPESNRKKSYVVPCSSQFRDAVMAMADGRGVNVGDIARSVMLVVVADVIRSCPDPGEPGLNDRETVVLKSGPSKGKPWRRKPRLQVRLPAGYRIPDIRRALGLALAMDKGDISVTLEDGRSASAKERLRAAREEIDRLRSACAQLMFEPLADGVQSRADALYVLGFPPHLRPSQSSLKARFRALATIYHPDTEFGDTRSMAQLNQAMALLRREAA